MPSTTKLPLTSAEIANLWTVYMADTLVACIKKHLIAKAEDEQIRAVLQQALYLSEERSRAIDAIFSSSNLPVPMGYSDEDVTAAAPRLYSDTLALYHTISRTKWAMTIMSSSLYLAVRPDVRKLFKDAIVDSMKLNEQATQLALAKGLLIRSPIVSTPESPHTVEKPSYLGSLIGEPRPLHVISVMYLFLFILENTVGKAMITGFSQVARDPEVRKYFLRGAEISAKHIQVFSSLLSAEDVPIPSSSDSMLTNSTIPPFSDKLMLNHILTLNWLSLADAGLAMGQSMRADMAATYLRLGTEVVQYGEDGMNIAIKKGWLEAPPQVISHRELALSGKY